jgi:hypothetical protein
MIQYFKDDATAGNGAKKDTIEGKGVLNNRISEYLMTQLAGIGVPTHFIRRLNMREQLIREVEIIPLEVVVRNVAAGSLSQRLGIEEGTALPRSIIEFYYKNDALNDPMVSEEHITAFGWATPQEIAVCQPFLQRQIALIQPAILICMGDDAAQTLMGLKGSVIHNRGVWQELPGEGGRPSRAIATLAPSYLLRATGAKRAVWRDLIEIRKALDAAL